MSDRQPVGQPTGSAQASLREGATVNGRTLHAGHSIVAGAGIVPEIVAPTPVGCGATKKDGSVCTAPKVKTHERCIGHLRGSQEGE